MPTHTDLSNAPLRRRIYSDIGTALTVYQTTSQSLSLTSKSDDGHFVAFSATTYSIIWRGGFAQPTDYTHQPVYKKRGKLSEEVDKALRPLVRGRHSKGIFGEWRLSTSPHYTDPDFIPDLGRWTRQTAEDDPKEVAKALHQWWAAAAMPFQSIAQRLKQGRFPDLRFGYSVNEDEQQTAKYVVHLKSRESPDSRGLVASWDVFSGGFSLGYDAFDPEKSVQDVKRYFTIVPTIHFDADGTISFRAREDAPDDPELQQLRTEFHEKVQTGLSESKARYLECCERATGRVLAAHLYLETLRNQAEALTADHDGLIICNIPEPHQWF